MTQFQTIQHKGFEAQVTARVTSGYDVGLIYLEMAGAEAEIRAIWAKLVSANMKKKGYIPTVTINGSAVRMEKYTKYAALRSVLPDGQHVIALLHPRATVIEPGGSFYVVDEKGHEGPPSAFFPRLAQALSVPIKEEWASWLWEKGQEWGEYDYQKLVKALNSDGHVVGYSVNAANADAWLGVIREQLGFKTCERCKKPVRELVKHKTIVGHSPAYQREVVEMLCPECDKGGD